MPHVCCALTWCLQSDDMPNPCLQAAEIASAEDCEMSSLVDKETDDDRVKKKEWCVTLCPVCSSRASEGGRWRARAGRGREGVTRFCRRPACVVRGMLVVGLRAAQGAAATHHAGSLPCLPPS